MKTMHTNTGWLLITAMAMWGCERGRDVNKEVEDLKQAEQESPHVASELQKQLNEKKAEVARLEEKVALARQGVTDEVVEQKNELKAAVKHSEQAVDKKIEEAQAAARRQEAQGEQAARQLGKTEHVKRVEAEVKTETHVIPGQRETEVREEQEVVPLENTRVIERSKTEAVTPDGGR